MSKENYNPQIQRMLVRLDGIKFSQDSASYVFSDNSGNMRDLFKSLLDKTTTIATITRENPLQVYRNRNVNYSCNNRRLCAFKEYEKYLKKTEGPASGPVQVYVQFVPRCGHRITCRGDQCDEIIVRDTPAGLPRKCPGMNFFEKASREEGRESQKEYPLLEKLRISVR